MFDLRTEYELGNGPVNLLSLRGKPDIPTTGPLNLLGFRGKSNIIRATLTGRVVNANAQNYFPADKWAGNAPKELTIASGAVCGSFNIDVPALRTGSGFGGTLTIINNAEIQGAAGGNNSGRGGHALLIDAGNVTIINNSAIRAGGGGGGIGGNGGGGFYDYTVQEGPHYRNSNPYFYHQTTSVWVWDGQMISSTMQGQGNWVGGWRYYYGNFREDVQVNSGGSDGSPTYRARYEIYRQTPRN